MLFVALRAERDGHDFVAAAVAAGAGGALVTREWAASPAANDVPVPLIGVEDTGRALLDLGGAARQRLAGAQVVGITGSVGKTSTKDLTAAAVASGRRVAASEKSFNNEIGVPLTLANAPEPTEVVVLEMGARGRGHLQLLCGVAEPTIGVVTAVAAAHTAMFGDLDAVAAAKGELVEALPAGGVAVLNADDARVAAMASRTAARVLRYSAGTSGAGPGREAAGAAPRAAAKRTADLVASDVVLDDELRPRFMARTPWGDVPVVAGARGRHQVGNALAALAVAGVCGVDLADAAGALERAALSPWRMELGRTAAGALVLNDAYNANPASMAAALDSLVALPASRRVAVLGEMAELGDLAEAEHRAVAVRAAALGISVMAVDTPAYGVAPVGGVEGALASLAALRPPLGPGDAILVKASRVAGLEEVAAQLLGRR